MKTKLFFIINLLIISTLSCLAQHDQSAKSLVRDTLFVYDTLYVTDTVFIKNPSTKKINTESIPSLSTPNIIEGQDLSDVEKILMISSDGTATLFENSIINANNINQSKKSEEMKKLKFIGLLVFAFQNMVLAQNDIGISFGSGIHFLDNTYNPNGSAPGPFYVGSSLTKATINIGLNYRGDFAADKLFFQTGLNYHFLPVTPFDNVNNPALSAPLEAFKNNDVFNEKYHLFSLPFGLYVKTKRISPGIGAEGYFKTSSKITNLFDTDDGTGNITPQKHSYRDVYGGGNIFGAVQIHVSKRLDLNLKYSLAFTKELVADYNGVPFTTRMQRADVTLRYRIGSKTLLN